MQLCYDRKRWEDHAHALAVAHWLGSAGIAFQRHDLDRYIVITTLQPTHTAQQHLSPLDPDR